MMLDVLRLAEHRTVEIDDVEPLGTLLRPDTRLIDRVVVVDLHRVEPALLKPHGLAVEDVDCGEDLHACLLL